MRKICSLPLIVQLALLGSAQAITIRDEVSDATSQTLATGSDYAPVGQFTRVGSDITSGVLIAPSYVLTAGHIIQGSSVGDFVFTIGGLNHSVVAYTVSGQDDLAIFQLATAVVGITPALLYTGSAEVGTTATIVGFGLGGNGSNGGTLPKGVKRAATNVIDATNYGGITPADRLLYFDFDDGSPLQNRIGARAQTTNEGLFAVGDSGGGVFATINAQSYLIGINSFVAVDGDGISYNYGDIGGAVRVSTASTFIQSVVPEPSISGLVLLGTALLGLRRRR